MANMLAWRRIDSSLDLLTVDTMQAHILIKIHHHSLGMEVSMLLFRCATPSPMTRSHPKCSPSTKCTTGIQGNKTSLISLQSPSLIPAWRAITAPSLPTARCEEFEFVRMLQSFHDCM